MSEDRVLLIENAAHLQISKGRLCIQREGFSDVHVLPEDVAVLVLHHTTILLSSHVLQVIAGAGGIVLTTDARHLPLSLMLPYIGHSVLGRRLRQQIAHVDSDAHKQAWKEVVQSRIVTQSDALKNLERNGHLGLHRLNMKVKSGDVSNVEAQAAKYYWRYLLPDGWRRSKRGAEDPLNARLNFGYAVLRSLVARKIVAAGLNPALGIGHSNADNPFNLADDFMEPYRCSVDVQVMKSDWQSVFNGASRVALLDFLSSTVLLGKSVYRLPQAIGETIASYGRMLAGRGKLILPGKL